MIANLEKTRGQLYTWGWPKHHPDHQALSPQSLPTLSTFLDPTLSHVK